MIPIGTALQPRDPSDPVVRVCGVEADRYQLQPVEFGRSPVFALDFDEISTAYDCGGYKIAIVHESEADQWKRMSSTVLSASVNAARRVAREEEALPTPEDILARESLAAVEAEKPKRRLRR